VAFQRSVVDPTSRHEPPAACGGSLSFVEPDTAPPRGGVEPGFATTWDEGVYRGSRDDREVVVFWLDQGAVVAGMNVNVWDVADDIATLVESKRPVDSSRLADPAVDLSAL
jgi:Reductase C-terminal